MLGKYISAIYLYVFLLDRVAFGCPVGAEPSWSISSSSSTGSGSPLTRSKRDVSLSDRSYCDGATDNPFAEIRVDTSDRVQRLISEMKKANVNAYIVPSSDAHLSEYISKYDKRRDYISGFTGSAGTAVVLADGARSLWTDGRYFLQADQELDCNWLLMKMGNEGVPTIPEWLKKNLAPGSIVGADPKLVSAVEWIEFEKELNASSVIMKTVSKNLVDTIWPPNERPLKSNHPIEILELKFAGKKWEDKITDLRKEMSKEKVDLMVITAMDEVAWLFNLRGGDVPYTPVFRGYALIDSNQIRLFIDTKLVDSKLDLHLHVNQCDQECVEIESYSTILESLRAFASRDSVKKVLVPKKYSYSGGASYAIYSSIAKEKLVVKPSPVLLMKARKNPVERRGMMNAHVKDAIALIDFLSFLEAEIMAGKQHDELSASERLEGFRAEQKDFKSPSFETISAFGSNGAIIHYRPSEKTKKVITDQSLYLLDSGGQYKDGTTDVTRTVHFGTPTEYQKETYTRVLKGAVDVAMLTFPNKTKDTRVDVLARRSLFEVGLDYKHGTGHGIGMFLSIHEGPTQMRIFGKEEHDLEEGHFFSDEPGYYKPGDFGIRLETILSVVPVQTKYGETPMLGFIPVTLVPFEPKLIDLALLSPKQCAYVNGYHSQIRKIVGPALDTQNRERAKAYMMKKTEPLNCSMAGKRDVKEMKENFDKNIAPLYSPLAVEDLPKQRPQTRPTSSAQASPSASWAAVFNILVFLSFNRLLLR